jgi:calcineurin-like phosphoesterase family protein
MWLTSDHHFYHCNIIKYQQRPFIHMDDMHAGMMGVWNTHIKSTDIVYYLGDFCLGRSDCYRYILSSLNYKNMVFLHGNHDISVAKLNKLDRIVAMPWIIMPIHDIGNVLMAHEPIYDYDTDTINLQIHGHIHTQDGTDVIYRRDGRVFFHVGVDTNDFKPWNIKTITKAYRRFVRNIR